MACKVAPCMPHVFFRSNLAGGQDGVASAAALPPAVLCQGLEEAVEKLLVPPESDSETEEGAFVPLEVVDEQPAETVKRLLGAVLMRLDQVRGVSPAASSASSSRSSSRSSSPISTMSSLFWSSPTSPSSPTEEERSEGCDLILGLLRADVPASLLSCLHKLEFEARKDVTRLFSAMLKSAVKLGCDAVLVSYLHSHPRIAQQLLDGSGCQRMFCYFAQMLRACTRYAQLVEGLLQIGAAERLMEFTRHPSFDVSCEAFASLRELLLAQRAVSALYIGENFDHFFSHFHALLQPDIDYVARRQALRLLGDVLLDRAFMTTMLRYVTTEQFLQIHMNLLRDTSKTIQVDAFHIFKIFVANPQKPARVQTILFKNRERLLKLLAFLPGRSENIEADLTTVTRVLKALEGSPTARRSGANASTSMAVEAERGAAAATAGVEAL